MRFIIHHAMTSKSSPAFYNLGKMLLYFLGEKIHLSGINQFNYFMIDTHKKEDNEFKLATLIRFSEGDVKQQYESVLTTLKNYKKLKNKNSQIIIQYNLIKKAIEKDFEIVMEQQYDMLELIYGVKSFKGVIDYERVDFYHLKEEESIFENPIVTSLVNILSLELPEEDGAYPVLFLGNEDPSGNSVIDLECYSFQSDEALQMKHGYLVDTFQFPGVRGVPATVMKAIADEFSKTSKIIREQLQLWTKTCYDHPNSKKGIEFFRENIVPLIEEKRRLAFEINTMQEIVKTVNPEYSFHLQFGELPIEKIWELVYKSEKCTEEDYNSLLKLKVDQSPKYDGRWPVVFFKTDNTKVYEKEDEIPGTLQPRKTLDID